MSVVENPEQKIVEAEPPRKVKPWTWAQEELLYLVRGFSAYPLYALLFGALALFTLAYQFPLDFRFKTGGFIADHLYAASFNQPESNGETAFRWSSDESYLRFPGAGRLPHSTLEITMQVGGRPANLPLPQAQVWVEGQKIGEVTVQPGEQVYRFDYRPQERRLQGDLVFTLRVPDAFTAKDHNLPLGVVVSEVRLRGGPEDNSPVIPALPHLALLLTGLVVFYLALVRSGWSATGAGRWSGLLAVGAAIALALARLQLTPAVESLVLTMLIAYPLLVLGLRTTSFWLQKISSSFILPTSSFLRWLGLIFFAAFTLKAAGLNHPAFVPIDHWFRLHQILRFWDTPASFWQQYYNISTGQTVTGLQGGSAVLGQWGISFALPYSPLFYLFAAPLALIWHGHDPNLFAAINVLASWLEASSVFLIYIIARQAYQGKWAGRAGIIAAGLYGFYPLSFLLFSDGGYNSILAHWLTLFFVALLFTSFNGAKSRWLILAQIVTLGLALLAHTSTLLLLGSLVVVAYFGLTIYPQRGRGRDLRFKKQAKQLLPTDGQLRQNELQSSIVNRQSSILWVGLGGFGLAFVLYYGWYIIPFVTDSLPKLLGKLDAGGIGQDRKLLGTPLLTGFWPQLWEHFRFFPFLLTIVALIALFPFRAKSPTPAPQPPTPNLRSWLFFTAWMVVFLLFSLLDLKVNLLQKHMLFAAPLLCLGSGFALSLLYEWVAEKKPSLRWTVGALTGLLIGFIVWQGVALWYARVFYYTLPPGSG